MRSVSQYTAVLFVVACGAAEPQSKVTHHESGSRYAQGDFVVYSYTGTCMSPPLELREQVTRVEGLQLTMDVTLSSVAPRQGADQAKRQWVQVVTDTAENREANRVDVLYERRHGRMLRLENKDNQDLLRLLQPTFPPCQPQPVEPRVETRTVDIAGTDMECTCTLLNVLCDGKPGVMTNCTCPDFKWSAGYADVQREQERVPFWQVTVKSTGP